MIGGLVWVRLVDGRLWHLTPDGAARTLCDRHPSDDAELLVDAPPARGQVCTRCVETVAEQARLAHVAWSLDPRRRKGDRLPADADSSNTGTSHLEQVEQVPSVKPADLEPAPAGPPQPATAPGKPDATADLVAALRGSLEAARARRAGVDPEAGIQQLTPGEVPA